MKPATKLAAFILFLVLAFGLGSVVGAAVGPVDVGGDAPEHVGDTRDPSHA